MNCQWIQWYWFFFKWNNRNSIDILNGLLLLILIMVLNETSGHPMLIVKIQWNISHILNWIPLSSIILNEAQGNLMTHWWYWVKHYWIQWLLIKLNEFNDIYIYIYIYSDVTKWIQWYIDDIAWNISESNAIMMLLNETSGHPMIIVKIEWNISESKDILNLIPLSSMILMKHKGIWWYINDIEWNPMIYQGIQCCIDEWNIGKSIYTYWRTPNGIALWWLDRVKLKLKLRNLISKNYGK